MAEIPIYKRQKTDDSVRFGAGAAGVIREQVNASDRLQARLAGGIDVVTQLAMPIITEETKLKAIQDVKDGNINSKSVAAVAQDVYKRTAESSLMADVEVGAKELGTNLVNEQTASGRYDLNAINSSWNSYVGGTTAGIKDITIKNSIEQKLAKMGQQFQGQVATLQTVQQRKIQQKNLKAKLEMDTESLKASLGVNAEDTIQTQTEIASTLGILVESNMISSDEATQLNKGINKEAYLDQQQRAFKAAMIAGNGEKFIEKFDKSKQPLLDETEKLRKIASFEAQMSDTRRDANSAGIALKKTYKLDVNEGIKVYKSGKRPDNELILDEQVKMLDEGKQREYQRAKVVQSAMSRFSDFTLPEQEAYINSAEAKEISNIYGVEVLNEAKEVIANKKRLAKTDHISLAVQDGIFYQPKTITFTDLSSLGERSELNAIASGYYGTSSKFLTSTEAEEISTVLNDINTPMSSKLDFLERVQASIPSEADTLYNQLLKKGASVYAFAGSLISEEKRDVAVGVLRGHELLKTVGPQDYIKESRRSLLSKIGNAMTKSSPQDVEALVNSSLAYAVFLAEKKGDITDLKGSNARQAINDLTNGMHQRNNQDLFLPNGVDSSDFDDWIEDRLSIESFKDVQGMKPAEALAFTQGNKARITSVGAGRYAIYDSMGRTLQDTSGKPLIIRY